MAEMALGRRGLRLITALGALVVVVGCGTVVGGASPGIAPAAPSAADTPTDPGLVATASGFTFVPERDVLPSGGPTSLRFRIVGSGGRTVTSFAPVRTRPMHLYVIRSDLTGFQHVQPAMAPDGTWTAELTALRPGAYRAVAEFSASGADGRVASPVLGVPVTVPGQADAVPLPPADVTTGVDGYTVTVAGHLMPDMAHLLAVTITRAGRPVTDLQPFLGGYAYLTAFQAKYQIFADLQPEDPVTGGRSGPTLTFRVTMPEPGNWRFFLEFMVGGSVHTAAITRTVA